MSLSGIKSAAIGCFCMLFASFPVLADDTEIFFASPAAVQNTRPNVLFILDSSGSMSSSVGSTGLNRMEHMKAALHTVLDSVTNVNIGLMRFNDPGGPILFPTSYVDEEISTAASEESPGDVSSQITNGSDDVEEIGSTMLMDFGSTTLDMAYGSASGGSTTIERTVAINTDDEEQKLSGNMAWNGSWWNLQSDQINGVRFQNIDIPPGATISDARLTLTACKSNSADLELRFYGQDDANPPTFENVNNNISDRPKTTAFTDWSPTAWTKNDTYTSPNMSVILQEIIDRPDWVSGNPVVLLATHVSGGDRCPYTRNGSVSGAPQLSVTYTAAAPQQQKVGLRFSDIAIPQGATITSATIEFTAAQSSSDAVNLAIKGVAQDDAAPFGTTATSLSSLSKTTASVSWTPEAWVSDTVYQTADISSVVQEVVNRSGWCGNNHMAFEISGSDLTNRVALSYEGDPSRAPRLRVTYDPDSVPATGGCFNQWVVYRVDRSVNDAEQDAGNGNMSITGNQFDIRSTQVNGLRFGDVRIANGATILEAHLQFTARASDTSGVGISIKGENADNAEAYSSAINNISDRPTVGVVNWTPGEWITNGTYESPDLSSVIESIVARPGWSSGNAMAFVVGATGSGRRRAYTYDDSAGAAPLLRVKVQFGGLGNLPVYTVRNKLHEIVEEFVPSGYTPIVDTLYEAASYYRGEDVLYGRERGNQVTYGRLSHPSSYTGGTVVRGPSCTNANPNSPACVDERIEGSPVYISPIVDECQSSYIVLLTDGQANHNNSADLISSLTGATCTGDPGEECGRELVDFLATADQRPSPLNGIQNVRTYTVGFNLDEGGQKDAIDFLKDLAQKGDGEYHSASTASELAGVFQNIIREILAVDTTFVAPGATVNSFNRLTHRNEIYFSLFKPSSATRWPGNLKRYGLYGSATEATEIVDVNGSPAVDAASGFFKSTARSWWSDAVDGSSVTDGGAASQMPAARDVYTYTGTSNTLSHASNALSESNTAITKAMLGMEAESDAYFEEVLQWARGVDKADYDDDGDTSEIRKELGDPLHSVPVIATYGGTDASPDTTVFFGTNNGFIHAVDASTGAEQFAFIPPELLVNLERKYRNSSALDHIYGMDGGMTLWVKDVNGDAQITSSEGDHVYLYVGMRRGGSNYYALDVTNRSAPRLMWSIQGGAGDFSELAQSWSEPVLSQVKIGTTVKKVLIFGGGYDTDNDVNAVRTADSEGRAIFMVDAESGDLLWSAGPGAGFNENLSAMLYSIPSEVRVIDMNYDGLADQMYVGDMGGQVWRFDIHNGAASADDLVSATVVADLAIADDASGNRKFYYAPDLVKVDTPGYPSLALLIGSGWRAHPLDTIVEDRFYMIRMNDIYGPPFDADNDGNPDYPASLDESDLYDATDNDVGELTGAAQAAAYADLTSSDGWFIRLTDGGEKVLSRSTTINNQVFFTTYAPLAPSSVCGAAEGGGYIYAVDLWTAAPIMNLDAVGDVNDLTRPDRRKQLGRMGIPPSPKALLPEEGNPIIVVGPEQPIDNIDFGTLRRRTYWTENRD